MTRRILRATDRDDRVDVARLLGAGLAAEILGGKGGDSLVGGAAADLFQGGIGKDLLLGRDGDDWLWGGGGADTLDGGAGQNVLRGGGGDDVLVHRLLPAREVSHLRGDRGMDLLVLRLDAASAENLAVLEEIDRLRAFLSTGPAPDAVFTSDVLALELAGVEALWVEVDRGLPALPAVDLDAIAAGLGGFKIKGEAKDDRAGAAVSAGDVNGDGLSDLIIGAPLKDAGVPSVGAAYVVYGSDRSSTVSLVDVAAGNGGFRMMGDFAPGVWGFGPGAGSAASAAGDVNGDGLGDIILGLPNASDRARGAGAAVVVFGKTGGDAVDLLRVAAGEGGFRILGVNEQQGAGSAVANAGDVNGDGLADLIIGGLNRSTVYVVFGKAGTAEVDLAEVADGIGGFAIRREDSVIDTGFTVTTAGDVNGDGLSDLLVSGHRAENGSGVAGAAYVIYGKADGSMVRLSAVASEKGGFKIFGETPHDYAGVALAAVGDVNGDGCGDLLVGAPDHDIGWEWNIGAAYLVFGDRTGQNRDLAAIARGEGRFKIIGERAGDRLGIKVSAAGDLNADGLADLLIGTAPAGDFRGPSGAYVVFGRANTDTVDLADVAAGHGGFKIVGQADRHLDSAALSAAGDVNGDGLGDLILGAPDASGTGAAYVIFGSADWLV